MGLGKKIIGILLAGFMVAQSVGTFNIIPIASANDEPDKPAYLIDENFGFMATSANRQKVVASGWDVQRAGGSINYGYMSWFKITDNSDSLPVVMNRKIVPQEGKITLEYRFKFAVYMDGVEWQLRSGKTPGVSIRTKGNSLYVDADGGSSKQLQSVEVNKDYGIKAVVNIGEKKADIYVNGALKASGVAFANAVSALDNFQVKTGEAAKGDMYFSPVKLYKGYLVNERYITSLSGQVSDDWKVEKAGGSVSVQEMKGSVQPDVYSMTLEDTSTDQGISVAKTFEPQNGDLVFEYKTLYPKNFNGAAARLISANNSVFTLVTENGSLCYVNKDGANTPVYKLRENMWYSVKVKINAEASKADIYINGKLQTKEVELAGKCENMDTVRFETSKKDTGSLWLDDILVYREFPLPSDYVPEPQKVQSDSTIVGIQNCSMWRDGYHLGWDRINAFPDRKPYLGFYDEGTPEVADWEIKWLVEHGVNYQLFCWFRPTGGEGVPVKDPSLGSALHDGYFNAKYSNSMKFAFVWENNASIAKGSKDFRENIVPYWIEYYLKDPRYLTVDNKPVIAIFSIKALKRDFGNSNEAVKAELDYLREACKEAGFPEVTLMTVGDYCSEQDLKDIKAVGFDYIYNYTFGVLTGEVGYQKSKILQQQKNSPIDMIPSLGMGRDDSAWEGRQGTFAKPEDFEALLQWSKDTFMPSLPQNSLGRKMVLLDNWNEFGEGHFIMPTELAGFGYLDAIRNVFAGNGEHEDIRPTQTQIDRIDMIYPRGRTVPINMNQIPPVPQNIKKSWEFNHDGDSEGWQITKQVDNLTVKDGTISGTATGTDAGITTPGKLGINIDDVTYVRLKLKNSTPDSTGVLYFTTEKDTKGDEAKAVYFYVNADDDRYSTYDIYVGKNKNWMGTLNELRLDPTAATGSFSVDSITLLSQPATDEIKVKIDEAYQKYGKSPEIIQNRTMVPLRGIFESLGAVVDWDGEKENIIAAKDGKIIKMHLGDPAAYIDNKEIKLDQPPVEINGSTLVPIRFVSEALGAKVDWDDSSNTVVITSQAQSGNEAAPTPAPVTTPSAQTPSAVQTGSWEFNTDGDAEGWTANSQIDKAAVKGGYFSGTSIADDPIMRSQDNLGIDTSKVQAIKIKYKNSTPSTDIRVYFLTNEDQAGNEEKSFRFEGVPNDPGYTEYTINAANNKNWKGTLKQLRFDPTGKMGNFSIDYIRLVMNGAPDTQAGSITTSPKPTPTPAPVPVQTTPAAPSASAGSAVQNGIWEFNTDGDAQGWTANVQTSNVSVKGGYFNGTAISEDPILRSPDNLEIDTSKVQAIKIKFKNSTPSTDIRMYFLTNEDQVGNEDKGFRFEGVPNDTGYTEYTINVKNNKNWKGTLKQLRFDPTTKMGNFSIDYIMLVTQ